MHAQDEGPNDEGSKGFALHDARAKPKIRGALAGLLLFVAFFGVWGAYTAVTASTDAPAQRGARSYDEWATSYTAAHMTLVSDVDRGASLAVIRADCGDFKEVATAAHGLPSTGNPQQDAAFDQITTGLSKQASLCDDAFAGSGDPSVVVVSGTPPEARRFLAEETKLQAAIDAFNGVARGSASASA